MIDFDPNDELDSQEQADAYINWCAENFMRMLGGAKQTYRTGVRGAHWLLVVATAQLHLDEEVIENREPLLEQLAKYQQLARALERQREHFVIERLVVLRSSLDCWESTGQWATHLLSTAKAAVSALILTELHPLVDLWDVDAPDVWAMLRAGAQLLAEINLDEELSFDDYAIRPDEAVLSKFTWQQTQGMVRRNGIRLDSGLN